MDPKGRISRTVQIILDGTRTVTTLGSPRLTIIGICSLLILMTVRTNFHLKAEAEGEACNYYVSTDGSDNQSGTSGAQAWSSFSHAIGQLHPGDVLCIADGTYNQAMGITLSGTVSDPITIRALNDNQVTLENVDTSVNITNSNFLSVEGITINGGRQGVYVTGSKHITLRRVYVFGTYSFGMWFKDNNDDFLITECRVENMTGSGDYGWGIRLYDNNGPGTGRGVVEKSSIKHGWRAGVRVEKVLVDFLYNVIEDWGGEGVRDHGIYYGNPPPVYSEGETTIIEGNIFRNNHHGFGLKISSWVDPINMIIRNNIFENNGVGDGNCCDGGLSIEHGNDGIQVYNNIFYENRNHAINIAAYNYSNGKFSRNIKVKNNIFYSTKSALILLMNDSTEGLEIDTNCYYSSRDTKFRTRINSNSYTNFSSLSSWQNNNVAPWVDEHSIFQDPKLSNPSQGDYSLRSDSPCIDKGIPLSEVPYDFNFVPRPQGNGVDIGAFEFDPGEPPSTFVDVPLDHWAHDYIETLYQEGYVVGCNLDPLMYCPETTMTRAESAVFVERGIHGSEYLPGQPTQQIFGDVPLIEWFAKWATALWNDGFTAGCGTNPLTYCPLQGHTRAEGSVFFLRMMYGADYVPPEPIGVFADVPVTAWYADWVEAAYNEGIIPACQPEPELRFCPEDPLDRAMAAYMMVQAKGLQLP